jgi:WD40 repeat protein
MCAPSWVVRWGAATGSLDMRIIVWDLTTEPAGRVTFDRAHTEGVTKLTFLDDTTLVSCGSDACLRVWTV